MTGADVLDDARARQLAHEEETDAAAAGARLQELRRASAEGDASLPRATRLIARLYADVEASLRAEAERVVRGNGARFRTWLRALPLDVAAVIAIRQCIQMCSDAYGQKPALLQALASEIGLKWELEVRIREAERLNPLLMQRAHDRIKEHCTRNVRHIRNAYNHAYKAITQGAIDTGLTNAEAVQVGKFGVQACMDAGLIELHRGVGKRGVIAHYMLTPLFKEFLLGYTEKDVALVTDSLSTAMHCPPDPWTDLYDGGYLSSRRKAAYPLMNLRPVRQSERRRLRQEFTAERMPQVFATANYLQSIAYEIHRPTMQAILSVWERGGGVLGVPTRDGPTKPPCPMPETWKKSEGTEEEIAVFSAWKHAARVYYEDHMTWRGKVREVGSFLKATRDAVSVPLWFPVHFDRRGRWYYRGTPNPQGSDLSKAVLHFHQKRPLGKDGVFWLKVHIANSAGYDKERFTERARWTEQNWSLIEAALDAPDEFSDVWGTDAPWCMFSAAYELREALRSGSPETYETGIVVHMDATCSGLQHFSALLRDPVGGMYVNLFDDACSGPKQDIYAQVAAVAMRAIQRDLDSADADTRAMAAWWMKHGITRNLAKKPVKS